MPIGWFASHGLPLMPASPHGHVAERFGVPVPSRHHANACGPEPRANAGPDARAFGQSGFSDPPSPRRIDAGAMTPGPLSHAPNGIRTMKPMTICLGGALIALLVACAPTSQSTTATNGASEAAVATAPAQSPPADASASAPSVTQEPSSMDAFKQFVPPDHRLLEAVRGDLGGPGKPGAVLVIDPPRSGSEKLGEGQPRLVLLVLADADGAMKVVASNRRLVPCAMCGGIAGDPYAYSKIEEGRVTVVTNGGSRERWSNDYTFVYEAGANRFVVDRVARTVMDTVTGATNSISLDANQLGVITFEDLDPAQLGDLAELDAGSD